MHIFNSGVRLEWVISASLQRRKTLTSPKNHSPNFQWSKFNKFVFFSTCISTSINCSSWIYNALYNLCRVCEHRQITDLALGHNKLTVVPPEIGQLTHITVLDLRNNQLSSLPPELAKCTRLADVIISFNRFTELPPVLSRLGKLENIIANDNQVLMSENENVFCTSSFVVYISITWARGTL